VNSATLHVPALAEVFAEMPGDLRPVQSGLWQVALSDKDSVQARIVDDWLVMTSPVLEPRCAADLLECNGRLLGWVKFALDANGAFQVRAELPLDETRLDAPAVHQALAEFRVAHAMLRGEFPLPVPPDPLTAAAQADLISLCAEAGWPAVPRGEDSVAVELECRGSFHQALLGPGAAGLRAVTGFAPSDSSDAEAAEAVAHFLLAASAEVCMVRPVVETLAGKTTPKFEFLFSSYPSAALVAHAFAALSVASRICVEEVRVLRDPNVARDYLALRGGESSASGRSATYN